MLLCKIYRHSDVCVLVFKLICLFVYVFIYFSLSAGRFSGPCSWLMWMFFYVCSWMMSSEKWCSCSPAFPPSFASKSVLQGCAPPEGAVGPCLCREHHAVAQCCWEVHSPAFSLLKAPLMHPNHQTLQAEELTAFPWSNYTCWTRNTRFFTTVGKKERIWYASCRLLGLCRVLLKRQNELSKINKPSGTGHKWFCKCMRSLVALQSGNDRFYSLG